MVGAIRLVSVERGHDPRDFALLPFGGAGPLHGGALARLLGMRDHPRAARAGRAVGARAAGVEPEGRVRAHLPAEGRRHRPRTRRARVRRARSGGAAPGSMPSACPEPRGASPGRRACATSTRASSSSCRGTPREVTRAAVAETVAALPPPARAALHLRAGGHAGRDRDAQRRGRGRVSAAEAGGARVRRCAGGCDHRASDDAPRRRSGPMPGLRALAFGSRRARSTVRQSSRSSIRRLCSCPNTPQRSTVSAASS